ncbi:organic radical activating enzyme [Bradyrhizobium sp. GM24.11]
MIVVWRVVDSCNLACGFCAYDKRLGFPRSQAAPADILRFAAVLAEHQTQTGDRVLLSWLGGEPLRWQPLQALTHAARELGLEVSATTNCTTLGQPGPAAASVRDLQGADHQRRRFCRLPRSVARLARRL